MNRSVRLLFCTFVYFGMMVSASAERRVALVIGNSDYEHTAPLKNPINDAIDVAAKLKKLGFTVIRGLNLDYMDLQNIMRRFTNEIEGADVALFFYAGHGLQVEGRNYLIPVSASLDKESDVDFQTIPLNLVLRQMERQKRTNLVFLDACRNNPLATAFARKIRGASTTRSTASAAVGRGLARVESGLGMLISYATSPGDVALDGEKRNSPYTSALLEHMDTPGVNINDLMISVRQDVLKTSRGRQIPWENSSLLGHFYFKDKAPQPAAIAAPVNTPAPIMAAPRPIPAQAIIPTLQPTHKNNPQMMIAAFEATRSIGTCGSYRAFKNQFKSTFYAVLAKEWMNKNCRPKSAALPTPPVVIIKPAIQQKAPAPTPKTDLFKTAASISNSGLKPQKPKVQKLAALDPVARPTSKQDDLSKQPSLQGRKLVMALQSELKRVGCTKGKIDGDWGKKSIKAITAYNKAAHTSLVTAQASMLALTTLRQQPALICTATRKFVTKCRKGQLRSRKGKCYTPRTTAQRKNTTKPGVPAQTSSNNYGFDGINLLKNPKRKRGVLGQEDNPQIDLDQLVSGYLPADNNQAKGAKKRKRTTRKRRANKRQGKTRRSSKKCAALIFSYDCPMQ